MSSVHSVPARAKIRTVTPPSPAASAWTSLDAIERNRRIEVMVGVLYPNEDVETVNVHRVGFARKLAEQLAGDPERTDVPAHVRRAYATALAIPAVAPESSPLPRLSGRGLTHDEQLAILRAGNEARWCWAVEHRLPVDVSDDDLALDARACSAAVEAAEREAFKAVLAARTVVVEWSQSFVCPTCSDQNVGDCPTCGPITHDVSETPEPTLEDRIWWCLNSPSALLPAALQARRPEPRMPNDVDRRQRAGSRLDDEALVGCSTRLMHAPEESRGAWSGHHAEG